MTAVLLERDSFSQTVEQGAPRFKGRAIIAFGHEQTALHKGTLQAQPRCASFGFVDEFLHGYYSALGLDRSSGFNRDGSMSIAPGVDFYGTLEAIVGVGLNRLKVQSFDCGKYRIVSDGGPLTMLESMLLLSGKTLLTKTGDFKQPVGTFAVTGVGFQPDIVIFTSFGQAAYGHTVGSPGERAYLAMGAATSLANQCSVGARSGPYLSGTERESVTRNDACCEMPNRTRVVLTSMDADGFHVDIQATPGAGVYVQYLALKDVDGNFDCGLFDEGDTHIPVGFEPEAMIFGGAGSDIVNTIRLKGNSMGFGAVDSKMRQNSGFATGGIGGGNGRFMGGYYNDSAFSTDTQQAGNLPAVTAEAVCTSFDATGANLNWTTGGGGDGLGIWIALKTSPGPGFEQCGPQPWVYRYRGP